MIPRDDTIVALSTPPGNGTRAVVRVSGPDSVGIVRRLAPEATLPAARYSAVRVILRAGEVPGFAAAVYLMRAPHSYTREDVAELHIPGSPALCTAVIRACIDAGARAALPGEFTLRAFMNGRIDLSKAEAVDRIIRASDSSARRAAAQDLSGRLSRETAGVEALARRALEQIEAAVDFSDQDAGFPPASEIRAALGSAAALARSAAGDWRESTSSCDPLVLLAGMTNAGKSSLLNALAGRTVSLVSRLPGTTRDVVTETLELRGRRVTIADPAGMGGGSTGPDAAANDMFRAWLRAADAIVAVVDGSMPPGDAEEKLAEICADRPCVWVIAKSDLPIPAGRGIPQAEAALVLRASAVTGEGVKELAAAIAGMACGTAGKTPDSFGRNARQRQALLNAADAFDRATGALDSGAHEICALEVRDAMESLGGICGRALTEKVLAGIFSGFCIGK